MNIEITYPQPFLLWIPLAFDFYIVIIDLVFWPYDIEFAILQLW
jgi:hypothetical protein